MDRGGSKIAVLVLDSSPIHTRLLVDALRRDHDLDVATVDSETDLFGRILDRGINVLLISAALDDRGNRGLQLLREVRALRPEVRAVVLLDYLRPEVVLEAFRAGARGVFSRFESIEQLCKCVRSVDGGQVWANSEAMLVALTALACAPTLQPMNTKGLSLLSKRETEIVESLAQGLTNREIAQKLDLSQHTVKNYLFRIFDKLGVSNRVELLFMSLNQNSNPPAPFIGLSKEFGEGTGALEDYQKAAEEGSPVAQLALAQVHKAREGSPVDMVLAYKWYLVLNAQLSHTRKILQTYLSPDQLQKAERMATDWLRRDQKLPAATALQGSRVSPGSAFRSHG